MMIVVCCGTIRLAATSACSNTRTLRQPSSRSGNRELGDARRQQVQWIHHGVVGLMFVAMCRPLRWSARATSSADSSTRALRWPKRTRLMEASCHLYGKERGI